MYFSLAECHFEDGMCGYKDEQIYDDFDWVRHKGQSSIVFTFFDALCHPFYSTTQVLLTNMYHASEYQESNVAKCYYKLFIRIHMELGHRTFC